MPEIDGIELENLKWNVMSNMPAKARAVAAQPNGAAAAHMFLLVLLLASLLASVVHARAEGPIAVPNHLIAADGGFATQSLSSTVCYESKSSTRQSPSLPSVPCGGCCGTACHAPAGLVMAVELTAPARFVHYFAFVVQAAHEPGSPDMLRPPIA
uniref:hypothetical protein n=1 Tax=Mesorhizobium atlanticum TaxID=2233532 RepID=UPI0037039E24